MRLAKKSDGKYRANLNFKILLELQAPPRFTQIKIFESREPRNRSKRNISLVSLEPQTLEKDL